MKGIVFNLLEEFVIDRTDEDTYDDIIDECIFTSDGIFVSPMTYPDSDFFEVVKNVCIKLKIDPETAQREFGKFCFEKLILAYPEFVSEGMTIKDFIKSVDQIVHLEVHKLYPGAKTPKFIYHETYDDILEIEYISDRNLCYFMEGVLLGCAHVFKSKINLQQNKCFHRGDDRCCFEIFFEEARPWTKAS